MRDLIAMPETHKDAIFCLDLVCGGCPINISNNKLYICRPNGHIWENALMVNLVKFPDEEIIDDEVASIYSKVWIHHEDWYPLNIEPNCISNHAYDICYNMLKVSRGMTDKQIEQFVEVCAGKSYSEAKDILGV